jgi:hypothetical protein
MPKKKRSAGSPGEKPPIEIAVVPHLFLWGVGGLVVSLVVVFAFPKLQPVQATVIAALVGLSGAAIATGITGILKVQTKAIVATGPFAVFILCFWAVIAAGAPGIVPDPAGWAKSLWEKRGS